MTARSLSLATALVAAACSRAVGTPGTLATAEATGDSVEALREQVHGSVALSCTASSQCRTRPVGAKPCGGPRSHLVYSVAGTDTAALARVAARYDAADAARNTRLGLVSDCTLVLAPEVGCASGTCRGLPDSEEEHP